MSAEEKESSDKKRKGKGNPSSSSSESCPSPNDDDGGGGKCPLSANAPKYFTRLSKQIKPSLSVTEISLCTMGWSFGVLFSIYHVFLASKKYYRTLSREELEMGWFGIGSRYKRDVSDSEWYVFSEIIVESVPWLILHFVGTQMFKYSSKNLIPFWWSSLGIIYVYKLIGQQGLFYLIAQPIFLYLVSLLKSSKLMYIAALYYVSCGDLWPLRNFQDSSFDSEAYKEKYISSVTNSWFNARSLSFCLDIIWGEVQSSGPAMDFVKMLAHCFYIPTCVGGPIINFKELNTGMEANYIEWTSDRIKKVSCELLRYSFWLVINNLLLHFFYFSALQYNLEIMEKVDLWTLCGIGYSMGQFFHMKYVVFYGMPRPFLMSDGIDAPPPPKCIGRIHLYSDMWRYFDVGLYKFLKKYFYMPVMQTLKIENGFLLRLSASVVTFTFVYIWHGIQTHVLVWSALNFIGITLEATAKALGGHPKYVKFEKAYLTGRTRRRLYSLLGAPLFQMSIISNFYFFMGTEIGNLFIEKTWTSFPLGTPTLLFFMYCGAQNSFEWKNSDIRDELRQSKEYMA